MNIISLPFCTHEQTARLGTRIHQPHHLPLLSPLARGPIPMVPHLPQFQPPLSTPHPVVIPVPSFPSVPLGSWLSSDRPSMPPTQNHSQLISVPNSRPSQKWPEVIPHQHSTAHVSTQHNFVYPLFTCLS